jgi:hypothetical protein
MLSPPTTFDSLCLICYQRTAMLNMGRLQKPTPENFSHGLSSCAFPPRFRSPAALARVDDNRRYRSAAGGAFQPDERQLQDAILLTYGTARVLLAGDARRGRRSTG